MNQTLRQLRAAQPVTSNLTAESPRRIDVHSFARLLDWKPAHKVKLQMIIHPLCCSPATVRVDGLGAGLNPCLNVSYISSPFAEALQAAPHCSVSLFGPVRITSARVPRANHQLFPSTVPSVLQSAIQPHATPLRAFSVRPDSPLPSQFPYCLLAKSNSTTQLTTRHCEFI